MHACVCVWGGGGGGTTNCWWYLLLYLGIITIILLGYLLSLSRSPGPPAFVDT